MLWGFRAHPVDLCGAPRKKGPHLSSISNGLRFAQPSIKEVYTLTLMKLGKELQKVS